MTSQAIVPARARTIRSHRPRLRGWSHAAATPLAVIAAVLLWQHASGPGRWSEAVFGIALIGLFGISGLYHVPSWDERTRYLLSRFDVAMIVLFIAGSFTPIAVHVLHGAWRVWSLTIGWSVAGVGAVIAASPIRGPRWLAPLAYVGLGWLGVPAMLKAMAALPLAASALIVVGALAYMVGAFVYARRLPDPWPHWFGFHEVFHLLVILGSAAHFVAIWRYVVPTGA